MSIPVGSRSPAPERLEIFYGRQGKPVKKARYMPAELAHQLARKLQAKGAGGTISVL